MSQPSLADRLVGVMQMAEKARAEIEPLSLNVSGSPRFELEMAIDEQINGLHQSFVVAWSNLDRLRQVAAKLPKPKRET